jgi:exodeoxyribonuclease VII large subunit
METPGIPPFITLLDISKEIQASILQRMNRFYWVRAEVMKLNFYRQSGHCYPQLVEKKDGQVVAELRATIWANDYRTIQKKFLAATGRELGEGMTILCYARVNYHPLYGLSLQIGDVDPSFTLGEMAMERTKTIQRLKAEGVWDQNRNLKLPLLPQRFAIISVETSKGYHDFRNILDDNSWGYDFFHLLFPALLQGDKAVESIGSQLDRIAKFHHRFDAVLIIRGGGGDVGLSCYDHYEMARKVATFPIPVISGIGHSTNETVVEMVSHTNAITPTDLAYGLIQHFHNFSVKVETMTEVVHDWAREMLQQEQRRTNETALRLVSSARLYVERSRMGLQRMASGVGLSPQRRVSEALHGVQRMEDKLQHLLPAILRRKHEQLDRFSEHARLLDPVNVLQRGYSITRHQGKALRSPETVSPGDELEITLYNGKINATVNT